MRVLLERDAELAAVRDAVDGAVAGAGVVVVVTGPAGIGKSSLLRAGTRGVEAQVLRALAGAHEAGIPFEVVRSLFTRRIGGAPPAERDALLGGPARAAAPLLGFGEPSEASESAFALHGLFWMTQELAAVEPLVLVVDDAQWADEPSLRYLAHLARRIEDLPVALLLGVRSGAASAATGPVLDEILHGPVTRRITLERLSDDASRRLAGDAEPELVAAARGNPFLIVSGLGGGDALATAVDHRVAEVGRDGRAVGEAVALLGGAADVATVAELTGLPPATVVSTVDRLADAGILLAGPPMSAAHPLLAEALLAGLGPTERAAAHGRAAAALHRLGADAARVASHALAAPPSGDPQVVEWLRSAAAGASRAGAPDAAARFLERALREPPSGDQLAAVQHELGTVETRLGRPAGTDWLLSAFDKLADPVARADIARQVAQIASFVGDDRSRALIEQVVGELPPSLESQGSLLRAGQLFNDLMAGLRPAPGSVDSLRAHADPAIPPGRFVLQVLALHGAVVGAPAGEVERDALAAVGTTETYEHSLQSGMPLYWAFIALDSIGRCPVGVARLLDRAKRSTRERGTVLGLAAGYVTAAELALARGSAADAIEEAEMALELAQEPGLVVVEARARAAAARAHLLRGEVTEARQLLHASDSARVELRRGPLALAHAELALAQGDPATACGLLTDFGDAAEAAGFSSANSFDWRAPLATALLALGEDAAAATVADAALAAARDSGGPRPLARALRAVARAGPHEQRAERLQEALDALDGSDLPLDRARTLLEIGAHRRRSGERLAARDHLSEALDLADRAGAIVIASRAREELLASGARPRRDRRWGIDALTPSELRIARLAARGMSNREIAAELFVTPKTVEVHLGRCYRKLDIEGRERLAEALDP